MRDNLVSFKILDRIIFTRECTIEIVDNIVNTVLVSLSIPITKCIDALNVFYKSHSWEVTWTIKCHFTNTVREHTTFRVSYTITNLGCNNLYFNTLIFDKPRQALKKMFITLRKSIWYTVYCIKVKVRCVYFRFTNHNSIAIFLGQNIVDNQPHSTTVIKKCGKTIS